MTTLARELALVMIAQGPGEWIDQAACRGADETDLMFPTAMPGTDAYERQLDRARAVCLGCPVRTECLEYALGGEDAGVWGGLDPEERRALARTRRFAAVPDQLGEVA